VKPVPGGFKANLFHAAGGFLLVFPFILAAAMVLARGVPDYPASGDGAILEISTRRLFAGGIPLGPYSRFVFFHPGPMYFALRFPLYRLFGMRAMSFLITTAAIGAGSLLAARRAVERCGSPGEAMIFSAVTAAFLVQTGPELWLSEWNPLVIALPLLLFFICCAGVGAGCRSLLLPGAIAGSFAVQTHLGTFPSVLITGTAAVAAGLIRGGLRHSGNGGSRLLPFLAAVLAVLWAAPLLEEALARGQGNISRIIAFMAETRPEHGFGDVYGDWSRTVTGFVLDPVRSPLHRMGILDVVIAALPPLQIVLLAMASAAVRKKEGGAFCASLCGCCLVLHGASLISGLEIRGERLVYLFEWMRILSPLTLAALLCAGMRLAARRPRGIAGAVAGTAVLAVFSVQASVGASGLVRSMDGPSSPETVEVRAMSDRLGSWLAAQPERPNMLVLRTPGLWPVMTGIVNSLEKRGYQVDMEGSYAVAQRSVPAGVPVRRIHVGRVADPGLEVPGTVASYGDIVAVLPPD
jgi:hypothetical protein